MPKSEVSASLALDRLWRRCKAVISHTKRDGGNPSEHHVPDDPFDQTADRAYRRSRDTRPSQACVRAALGKSIAARKQSTYEQDESCGQSPSQRHDITGPLLEVTPIAFLPILCSEEYHNCANTLCGRSS